MTILKGGRGKKAPYDTRTVRVPVDLIPYVEEFIEEYRELKLNGIDPIDLDKRFNSTQSILKLADSLVEAEKILKQKKSAKESMKKLLASMFPGEEINL